MALRIPDEDKDRFAKLLSLEPAALDALYGALEERPARLRMEDVVADIEAKVPIQPAVLREVMRLLLTLYWLRADQDVGASEILDQLFQAAEESRDERLKTPSAGWATVKDRLTKLLSLEKSLGVTSKALYIAYQFPCHYHSARVLTDARPVFQINPAEPPAAFLINHTLQLEIHEDGEDREWFLALNTDDLRELRKTIDRALEKERSLRALLEKTAVPILDWAEGEQNGD